MDRQEKISFLDELLEVASDGKCEAAVADIIERYLAKVGIETQRVTCDTGRDNLVASFGSGTRVLGFTGHLDVVPIGDQTNWNTDPFAPTQEGDKLFGRGTSDMKSGLAAMTIALIELKEEGFDEPGMLRLLATVGEETGLFGARQLTEAGYADDLEALIVGEPTDKNIVYAHKGIINYTVQAYGKSAHSSLPETGFNAIDLLLEFYTAMMKEFKALAQTTNDVLGEFTFCSSLIDGGTQANMVPDKASFTANLRTIPEVSNEQLIAALQAIVDRLNKEKTTTPGHLELTIDQENPPVFSDPESQLVKIAFDEVTKTFDITPQITAVPGATDAAEFIKGNKDMQIILLGPGNTSVHQANEYVDIPDYLAMCDVYKSIARTYFKR